MQISGFIVLLTGIILSRIINERGYRKLNAEQKIRLMDGFSTTRAYTMIPLLLLIAAFWFLNSETNIDKQILTAGYFGLLLVYIIARVVLNQRKIAQLELPGEYTRLFTLAHVVSFIGVAWVFFAMFDR